MICRKNRSIGCADVLKGLSIYPVRVYYQSRIWSSNSSLNWPAPINRTRYLRFCPYFYGFCVLFPSILVSEGYHPVLFQFGDEYYNVYHFYFDIIKIYQNNTRVLVYEDREEEKRTSAPESLPALVPRVCTYSRSASLSSYLGDTYVENRT